uniref:Ribosomal protein S1 n=1 Tax=Inkyuleea mariana TaxID=123988 RepID=A0A4D6WZ95_9FLOR|nr:ribosomal protein S1 [Inkyuleea mariana]
MQYKKGFTEKNFAYILNQYKYNLHPGDIVAGKIFNKEAKGFLVDIGTHIAGYLPLKELSLISKVNYNKKEISYLNNLTREFFILAYNTDSQQLILSIKRLEYLRAWKRIKQLNKEDIILNLKIDQINKGGAITYLEGLKGFIPNSHLTRNKNKIKFKEKKIKCKILIANEKNNQIICSNKSALLYLSTDKFKIGEIVYGAITAIQTYGIFIDINSIPALLHISEIGSKHIENIHEIFQIGNIIKVKIIHIDMKQGRLSVSRRNID